MTKKQSLQKIAEEIEKCNICKIGTTGKAVPGEGSPDAPVVFVGEAPGKQEAATGKPFIGRSGQLLREAIRSIGLSEEDVFITSIGKYLPVQGTPSLLQIAHGRDHLSKQLAVIQPKIVVLLGASATLGVLEEKIPVKSVHGTIREKNDISYFLTLHPAAGLRFPPLRQVFLEDFEVLKKFLQKRNLV